MPTTLARTTKKPSKEEIIHLRDCLIAGIDRLDELLQRSETVLGKGAPRVSPLDRVKALTLMGEDLRVANGNLSSEKIANLYGISLSQLADWLGRTRQAVSKTPDADSLQEPLAFFERVARLRAMVSADNFRRWLRTPNKSLDGKPPLELMTSSDSQIVADLVDDMLTGAPA